MQGPDVNYVTRTPEGGWRVEGSRVSLDSVVHAWLDGRSPEAIADSFPSLTLERIHGVIAFYLRHREEVDRHLAEQDAAWDELKERSEAPHGPLLHRIRASRVGRLRPGRAGVSVPRFLADRHGRSVDG